MDDILETIVKEKGVLSVNVVAPDGIVIKSISQKGIDGELISALSSKIASEIADKIGIKKNVFLLIKGENGYIFILTKKNFILSVLTDTNTNIGSLKVEMEKGAKDIEGLL
uniref:Roadblock/LAMTOR2 domain-containing protein n=1 Tax=candidate division WOR-3 bacterium TaxID=2052148 RepID=A0A7C4YGB2_UNCW3